MRVSFLIPAFNEEGTIDEVIDTVSSPGFDKQVIVVDDGSIDGTPEILAARHEEVLVLRRRTGERARPSGRRFRTSKERSPSSRTPTSSTTRPTCPMLIEPIERGVADVVYGSRLSGGKPQRAYLFWHLVGNRFLSIVTGLLYNTTLSDMETGYKAFRTDVLRSLELRERRLRDRARDHGEDLQAEAPDLRAADPYYGRTYAEGKKITWRDGFKAVWVLVRVRFS